MTPEMKTVWKFSHWNSRKEFNWFSGRNNKSKLCYTRIASGKSEKNRLGNDAYRNKWQWCYLNINYTSQMKWDINTIKCWLAAPMNEFLVISVRFDRLNIRKWKASISWFYEKRYHITGATFSQSIYILRAPTAISVISISIQNHQTK